MLGEHQMPKYERTAANAAGVSVSGRDKVANGQGRLAMA